MAIFEQNMSVSPWSKLCLDINRVSQDQADNSTTISYRLYMRAFGGGYPYGGYGGYAYNVKIDGTTITSGHLGSYRVPKNGTFTIVSGIRKIKHDASGKKTIAASGFFQAESIHGNATVTGSVTLPTIGRAANLTSFSIIETTPTSFTMKFKADKEIDKVEYSRNGGGWQATKLQDEVKVTGLVPGDTHRVSIRVKDKASQLWTTSNIITLSTLSLSTIRTSLDFTLGESMKFMITRASSNLYHDAILESWSTEELRWLHIDTLTNVVEDGTFVLSLAQQKLIYEGRKDSSQITVRIRLKTKWGISGALQGETESRGFAFVSGAKPLISGVTYKDTNATVQSVIRDSQTILSNKSTLQVTIGSASSDKGAKLSHYILSLGGKEYNYDIAGNKETDVNKVINVGLVDLTGNTTATLKVVDSRGQSTSTSFLVKASAYSEPKMKIVKAERTADGEEDVLLSISGTKSVVKIGTLDLNTLSIQYRVKQDAGAYGSFTSLPVPKGNISESIESFNASKLISGYSLRNTYTVEYQVRDAFTNWVSYVVKVTDGVSLVKVLEDKVIVSIPVIDYKTKQQYIYFGESEDW